VESIRGFHPDLRTMLEVLKEPTKAFYPIAEGKCPFHYLYHQMTEDVELKSFLFEHTTLKGRDYVYEYLFSSPRSDGEYLRCGVGGKVYIMDVSPAHEAVLVDDSAYGKPVLIIPWFNYMEDGKLEKVKVVPAEGYNINPSRRFKPYYDEWKIKTTRTAGGFLCTMRKEADD